jgi:hypothetical protein
MKRPVCIGHEHASDGRAYVRQLREAASSMPVTHVHCKHQHHEDAAVTNCSMASGRTCRGSHVCWRRPSCWPHAVGRHVCRCAAKQPRHKHGPDVLGVGTALMPSCQNLANPTPCRVLDRGSKWRACVDAAIVAFCGIHGAGAPHAEPRPPSDLLAVVAACRSKLAALDAPRPQAAPTPLARSTRAPPRRVLPSCATSS